MKFEQKNYRFFHQNQCSQKVLKKLAVESSRASFWRGLGGTGAPLGRSWAHLGRFLGASWTLLGVSWASLGALGCILGSQNSIWGQFGRGLGRVWGGFGRVLGGSWEDFGQFLHRFWRDVGMPPATNYFGIQMANTIGFTFGQHILIHIIVACDH